MAYIKESGLTYAFKFSQTTGKTCHTFSEVQWIRTYCKAYHCLLQQKEEVHPVNELVQRLSQGNHPVAVGGSKPSLEEFQKRVQDIGYVFIKFTATQGGTDLGVHIDKQATNLNQNDFAQGMGTVHIEGTLTLNYVKVRCIADIDLGTLNGRGHLIALEEEVMSSSQAL